MLLLLAGQMRSFWLSWPVVKQELLLDELETVGRLSTDVVILTAMHGTGCGSGAELKAKIKEGKCDKHWDELSVPQRLRELRRVYGHRLRAVISEESPDLRLTEYAQDPAVYDAWREYLRPHGAFANYLEWRILRLVQLVRDECGWRRPPIAASPAAHRATRALSLFGAYDIVLALRPDVILTTASPPGAHAFRAVDPLELCSRHSGERLISGSLLRPARFHYRDHDHGFVLCAPSTLEDHVLTHMDPGRDACKLTEACRSKPPGLPAPKPAHFSGDWAPPVRRDWGVCAMQAHMDSMCDRVRYYRNRDLPYDALPEAEALAHIVRLSKDEGGETPCTLWMEMPDGTLLGRPKADKTCTPYPMPAVIRPDALRRAVARRSAPNRTAESTVLLLRHAPSAGPFPSNRSSWQAFRGIRPSVATAGETWLRTTFCAAPSTVRARYFSASSSFS